MCKGVAGNADGILQLAEFKIHNDAIVLATPEIAGLPFVVVRPGDGGRFGRRA